MEKEFINAHKDSKSEIVRFLTNIGSTEDVEVLLIEWDLATIRLLEAYFKSKAHTCKGVSNGVSGLYLLRNFLKPKVVLTSISLPDMSGYEVCKRIKSDPDLKNIPVIFLTAFPSSEVEKHLAETEADGYILSPFNFSDFDGILDLLSQQKKRMIQQKVLRVVP
jgi:two-component system cell cycle response regulator DivK